jgi:hypothetical protein
MAMERRYHSIRWKHTLTENGSSGLDDELVGRRERGLGSAAFARSAIHPRAASELRVDDDNGDPGAFDKRRGQP